MRSAATLILWAGLVSPAFAQQAVEPGAGAPPVPADMQQQDPAAQPPVQDPAERPLAGEPAAQPLEGVQQQATSLVWTEDIEDRKIRTPQGDRLGEIEGVLLDTTEGRVPYVMVEVGGFLGIGERLVAVPWESLMPAPDGKGFVMNVTEDVLRAAPSAKDDNFEQVADSNWQQAVEAYWSQRAGLTPQ